MNLKTKTEFIADQIEKERVEQERAKLAALREPITNTGIACECGKELHWENKTYTFGSGPFCYGVKCECGKQGYWDWFNKEFVGL